jgi:hypothetical protein
VQQECEISHSHSASMNMDLIPSNSGSYYFFGGFLLVLGGLLEFILGNTFPSVVFSSYGPSSFPSLPPCNRSTMRTDLTPRLEQANLQVLTPLASTRHLPSSSSSLLWEMSLRSGIYCIILIDLLIPVGHKSFIYLWKSSAESVPTVQLCAQK